MSVKIASRYMGTMDQYFTDIKIEIAKAPLLKKYTANKTASLLGTPPADKEEIKQRMRMERRNKRKAQRARRARIVQKLARLRLAARAIAAGAVTLACPAAAPTMAAIVFQTYVETKIIEGVSGRFNKGSPEQIKEAKTALVALKAAKKQLRPSVFNRALKNKKER